MKKHATRKLKPTPIRDASPAAQVQALFEAQRYPGVISAYLFGSHARGTAHRGSDVDVGVVMSYPTLPTRADRSRLAERLGTDLIGATHCNEVDVVVLNDAPPELAATVVSRGQRLYSADGQADHDFVRTALLRHADIRPFLERTRRLKLEVLKR